MSPSPPAPIARYRRDPFAVSALLVALIALVFSMGGSAPAKRQGHGRHGISAKSLKTRCPIANAIKLGTWCLEASPHQIPAADAGLNDYFYATQTCVREGGWLPSAAQLIGAARKASLQSRADDSPATSGAEEFPNPTQGIRDKREMSGDLFTTTAGAASAGSEGVSEKARGSTAQGEPDPTPMPANPSPETLDYVTVYDNFNHGGFAGGEPVGKAESFRCAYAVGAQGKPRLSAGN